PSSNASARPPTGPDWPSTPNSTPTTTPKASKSPTSRSTRYGSPTTSFMATGTTHFAPNIAEQPTHRKGYFVPVPKVVERVAESNGYSDVAPAGCRGGQLRPRGRNRRQG